MNWLVTHWHLTMTMNYWSKAIYSNTWSLFQNPKNFYREHSCCTIIHWLVPITLVHAGARCGTQPGAPDRQRAGIEGAKYLTCKLSIRTSVYKGYWIKSYAYVSCQPLPVVKISWQPRQNSQQVDQLSEVDYNKPELYLLITSFLLHS